MDEDIGAQKDDREELEPPTDKAQTPASEKIEAVHEITPEEPIAVAEEISTTPEFTFGDGFRFGLGFTVAGCLVWLVVPLALAIIVLVLLALT